MVSLLEQRDHIYASITDTMGRYTPVVEPHRYRVRFVPVVDKQPSERDIKEVLHFNSRYSIGGIPLR